MHHLIACPMGEALSRWIRNIESLNKTLVELLELFCLAIL